MIKAEKLTFGFQSTYLFQDISFTLEDNCHCALIGSNGTGKTTLTNLIREPDSYVFDGKLKLDDAGRIGYVSQFAIREGDQSVTVFDYLCQDFLALEQAINDVCLQMETSEDMDALMERYQELLDESDAVDADNYEVNIRKQLKLAELDGKEVLELEKLSGGELKLVQVIRQMLRRPGVLIMDEPDVFLDFENLIGLRDLINTYKGTLLVVTHSRYLLAHCFDRIWHLENGDLQEFEGSFTEYSYSRLQKKIDLKLASIADEEEIGVHFVVSSRNLLAQEPAVTVERLMEEPFMLTEKGMSYRRLMDEKLARSSLEIQPVLETGQADLICSLVEEDAGVAFLPDYVTEESVRAGKVVRLNVPDFHVVVWKQLLFRREKWVSLQMRAMIDHLAKIRLA